MTATYDVTLRVRVAGVPDHPAQPGGTAPTVVAADELAATLVGVYPRRLTEPGELQVLGVTHVGTEFVAHG